MRPCRADLTPIINRNVFIEKDFALIEHKTNLHGTISSLEILETQIPHPRTLSAVTQGPQLEKQLNYQLLKQIKILKNKARRFINLNKRLKRGAPLEFIGRMNHFVFGQADPPVYRHLVSFMKENINTHSQVLCMEKQITTLSHKTLDIINDLGMIDNDLYLGLNATERQIRLVNSRLNIITQLLAVKLSTDNELWQINDDLNLCQLIYSDARNGFLNKNAINTTSLGTFVNDLTLNNEILRPPFPYNQIENYYQSKLAYVHMHKSEMVISAKIPLINFHQPLILKKTLHEIQHLSYILKHSNGNYRFMTELQLSTCLRPETETPKIICKICDIEIFYSPLKPSNNILVHDILHNKIFFDLKNSSVSTEIICPDKTKNITLRGKKIITLHPECGVQSKFFSIKPEKIRNVKLYKNFQLKIDEVELQHIEQLFSPDPNSYYEKLNAHRREVEIKLQETADSFNSSLMAVNTDLVSLRNDSDRLNASITKTANDFEKSSHINYPQFISHYVDNDSSFYVILFLAIFGTLGILLCCKKCKSNGTKIVNKFATVAPATSTQSNTICDPEYYKWQRDTDSKVQKLTATVKKLKFELNRIRGNSSLLDYNVNSNSDSTSLDGRQDRDQRPAFQSTPTYRPSRPQRTSSSARAQNRRTENWSISKPNGFWKRH